MTAADKPALMKILKNTPEFKPYEVTVAEELVDYYLVFISSTQIRILQHWLATNMEMPVETLIDFLTVVTSPGLFMKLFKNHAR